LGLIDDVWWQVKVNDGRRKAKCSPSGSRRLCVSFWREESQNNSIYEVKFSGSIAGTSPLCRGLPPAPLLNHS
jgi:hypothetical protein